jgi:hypothetical protein
MTNSEEEMLDRISDRMSELMSNDPDWPDQALEIGGMLDRSDTFVLPEGKTSRAWCQSLFQTPGLSILATAAIEMGLERGNQQLNFACPRSDASVTSIAVVALLTM